MTVASIAPELEALAGEAMAEWKVPAVAIAVVQKGETALLKAYGQRDVEAGLADDNSDPIYYLLDHQDVHGHRRPRDAG